MKLENQKGTAVILTLLSFIVVILLVVGALEIFASIGVGNAQSLLERRGYVVLAAGEYSSLLAQVDAIKAKTDNLPDSPANEITAAAAVENADAAVEAAENAVDAAEDAADTAEIAATKVDLFNSAEVFLFPDVTNVTITMTAGNTNVWSNWIQVVDSNAVTLSSKFADNAGYINDMYIYDHSAVDKVYCVELAYGEAKATLGRMM